MFVGKTSNSRLSLEALYAIFARHCEAKFKYLFQSPARLFANSGYTKTRAFDFLNSPGRIHDI